MSFASLNLISPLLQALDDLHHDTPTPIQSGAIPVALAGQDLMASAQTGTGKTAAFILPALQRLAVASTIPGRGPRVLVLSPTRELAGQIREAAVAYGRHLPQVRSGLVVGGMPYPAQQKLLMRPLDLLVATPGRLLDHIEAGRVDFGRLELVVLDEADRMLDMGFLHDVERIIAATPKNRQTVMFSATFDGPTAGFAERLLKSPQRIRIAASDVRSAHIEQHVHFVDDPTQKKAMLLVLLDDSAVGQAIVFTSTKRGADRLALAISGRGHATAALHGDMRQGVRNRTLAQFRSGGVRVLVATDVAARGIDVASISHVFNYDLPRSAEDYVHRIGRTGRAGLSGLAVSFATRAEHSAVRRIERYTGHPIQATALPGFAKLTPSEGSPRPTGNGRPARSGGAYRGASPGQKRPAQRAERPAVARKGTPAATRRKRPAASLFG